MKNITLRLASAFAAAALLTGCSSNSGSSSVSSKSPKNYDKEFKESTHLTLDEPTNYSAIDIDIQSGSVTVKPTDEKAPSLDIECRVYADNEEDAQSISNRINTLCRQNDDTMNISFVEKVSGKEVDEWIADNDEECRIELDAVLNVPTAIENIGADVDTGNINLNNISSKIKACTNTGNITCSGTSFTNSSYIECFNGNITCSDCSLSGTTMFKTETGSVDFGQPSKGNENGEAAIIVNHGDVNIKNGSEYQIKNGDPENGSVMLTASGCTVTVNVRSGKVNLDNKE